MSKLVAALRQIDAKSSAAPESPPAVAAKPAPLAPAAGDALEQLAELNRLLDEALASHTARRIDAPSDEKILAAVDETVDQRIRERVEPATKAVARTPDRPLPSSHSAPPVTVSREFAELAERLIVELGAASPAALTFLAADESADNLWLLPLAVALSQKCAGRVLIVEADGDKPQWAAHLGIQAESGLIDVLNSRVTWRDCVRSTALAQIDLLPRGIGNIAAVPESQSAFKAVLENAKSEYTWILTAAGRFNRPIAASISSASTAVVLIVDLKSTPRSTAEQAKQALKTSNARILGAIARA